MYIHFNDDKDVPNIIPLASVKRIFKVKKITYVETLDGSKYHIKKVQGFCEDRNIETLLMLW